eukprot:Blabericola_migrator_1__449@NODE_1107_length_5417_cov_89_354766_g12_i1_p2_GENE_NODE_1107_length_5417_cov_89_354766_g12_i1NODE_1107_length_5417_cov_89_354766_g12_i1_p2_ORF_typecomplete_len617_score62_07PhoD/PF09423_10/0_0032_NODE_1107_length_5417_cov_89_354766_g12_i122204070
MAHHGIRYDPSIQELAHYDTLCTRLGLTSVPDWVEDVREADIGIARGGYKYESEAVPYGNPGMFFPEANAPAITVGPVIGKVTHNSVRILVESNQSGSVVCYLRGMDEALKNSHKTKKTIHLEAGVPTTFEIKGLKSLCTYHVSFSIPYLYLAHSKFKTLPEPHYDLDVAPFHFALVSGNTVHTFEEHAPIDIEGDRPEPVKLTRRTHQTSTSLWQDLYEQVCRGNVKYIFHIGNQLCVGGTKGVSPFQTALAEGMSRAEAVNYFKSLYRTAWNEPWTKHVLANCANIMIGNETDFGVFVERAQDDSEWPIVQAAYEVSNNKNGNFGLCLCIQVYTHYQQNLLTAHKDTEDDFDVADAMISWAGRIFPEVGLIALDWRMPCTFQEGGGVAREPNDLLGKEQRKKIVKTLFKKFTQRDRLVKTVIVISPVRLSDRASFVHDSVTRPGTSWLLETLFRWKSAGPHNKREVVLLSGAPRGQYGGVCEIEKLHATDKRSNVIKEFSVGPLTTPVKKMSPLPTGWKKFGNEWSTGRFSFRRLSSQTGLNYAVITVGARLAATDKKTDAEESDFMVSKPVVWCEYKSIKECKPCPKKDLGMVANVRPWLVRTDRPQCTNSCC